MEPIPAGVHIGICYSVVDLGTHINATYGVEQRKVLVSWEPKNPDDPVIPIRINFTLIFGSTSTR